MDISMNSILARMSGSPRRVQQELEVEVKVCHKVKLLNITPMTDEEARKAACEQLRQRFIRLDPDIVCHTTVEHIHPPREASS
jgi:hypothetical protein